ncbi:Ycf66 family protein [Sphaerothrix gracilis]|uniref:Ycf66 family protein n=1 Tax=Sphaerothrix gracilis TaxID=3151835 RepID=UPI0031FCF543
MVNVGLSFASLIGIALAVSGAALYFLRSFRPNLARDHDVFFAAVALGAGGILFFNGWRLDPILQFGQLMLGGSAIFFAVESIRLRGVATEQAKQRTPVVDDDRPVSRVYRAELDDLDQLGDRAPRNRRIPASRSRYRDDYDDDYRRPERSESIGRLNPSSDRIRRRRPPRPDADIRDEAAWGEGPVRRPSRSVPPASRDSGRPLPGDRVPPRRSGPRNQPPRDESPDADYVNYRPVSYPEGQPEGQSDYPYPGI